MNTDLIEKTMRVFLRENNTNFRAAQFLVTIPKRKYKAAPANSHSSNTD